MAEAVIAALARTPIGRAGKGSLAQQRPDDLGALVLADLFRTVPELAWGSVDEVICGCATDYGQQGYNLGRVVGQLAGLPNTVPGVTVNRFCASSLQAVRMAAHAVRSGEGDVFGCVGVESVSHTAGRGMSKEHAHPRFTEPDRPDYVNNMYIPMGQTAENVARTWGIDRAAMDEYALQSHQRVFAARAAGFFDDNLPVWTPAGVVVHDDSPRPDASLANLEALTPSFCADGSVTAGNSCPLSDGAAAVLVMSAERAHMLGVRPTARILASTVTGLDPAIMGFGPVEAVRRLLTRTGTTVADYDVIELNEAFAAQVLAVCRELDLPMDRVNPHGGAISLGHPFGMTGARLVGALVKGLTARDGTLGLVTLCVGGGQGMAMAIERIT
jgi:acetyl-CoA C-acetyltransferase